MLGAAKPDGIDPLIDEPGILSSAEMTCTVEAARETGAPEHE